MKFWLRKHGATSSEVPVYVSDIRELLHQPSASEYQCQLDQLKLKWSEPFYCHYVKELDEKLYLCIVIIMFLRLNVCVQGGIWNILGSITP